MTRTTAHTAVPALGLPAAPGRGTRRALAAGVVAGPLFLTVGLVQATTRDGFDLGRHALSQLALGSPGWVQTAAFLVAGTMLLTAAAGLRRVLAGPGATWAPRLVAGFGTGMLLAGVFVADPAFGFPVGTPEGPGELSWHGQLHGLGFAVAMLSWVAACIVLAHRSAVRGERALATGYAAALVLAAVLGASPLAGGFGVRIVLVSAVQFAVVAAACALAARDAR